MLHLQVLSQKGIRKPITAVISHITLSTSFNISITVFIELINISFISPTNKTNMFKNTHIIENNGFMFIPILLNGN